MTAEIRIVEVGPRDGLQNEPAPVPPTVKVEMIRRLSAAGLTDQEVTSFVRPDRIPQLADAIEVATEVAGDDGLRAIALTPNVRGLQSAVTAGIREVAVFGAASEEFSRRNINRSVSESIEMFREVADAAVAQGLAVRGYVSTVLGCPYQGDVPVADVVRLVEQFLDMGCHEVSVADTIGVGVPSAVQSLFRTLAGSVPLDRLAFHGHDTYGTGLANALAAIEVGVRTIDTSLGGLGGCPYAGPSAKGNLATEELVYALAPTGALGPVDLDALVATSWWLSDYTGHPPRSAVAVARRR